MIERTLSVLHMINHDKEVTEVQQEAVVGRFPVLHRYQSTARKDNWHLEPTATAWFC
jgi:hypothetical protein